MKVSLNTVKQFTTVELSVDELVAKINTQLGGVESIVDLSVRYEGAAIVRIVTCEKHKNADKLSVCTVDDGGVIETIERDANGHVQVVCGAPNVRAGMYAVWLPPASTVPASFDEKELFVLDARELRGVMSQGMLASPQELALGDGHDGILEIDPDEWKPNSIEIKPGTRFSRAYGLDDTVIEIENKMFTHRPDCFGQLGVAREIAGIQHTRFDSPTWYTVSPEFKSGDGLELKVSNCAPKGVPRFMAVAIKDVDVKPSPVWLQVELVRLGSKPINNVVDVTNYLMLLTGQPLHAYDYDLLHGGELGARYAVKQESIKLLNGKTYQLDESDIVIVDGKQAVGLGGVMGGGDSEVSQATKNIVLECAAFDMYAIRKTSMRHGLFTDAVTRFNKGQSPLQNEYVLSLAMQSIFDVAGGELASQVHDVHGGKRLALNAPVSVSLAFINERLGLELSAKEIVTLLENVEFKVTDKKAGKETELTVTVPFWRTDIELPEDIVEEVGRLYGFDKLPRELPQRSIVPTPQNPRLTLKRTIRENLARLGASEVLTYSFVHERVLTAAGQQPDDAFRLSNALSPDLQYYRLSLLPSLLDKVHGNIKNGSNEFVLFEIGKAHHKQNLAKDGLPVEKDLVEFVYANKATDSGAAYYRAQRYVTQLLSALRITVVFEVIDQPLTYAGAAPYDQARSALIKTNDGITLGIVGELRQEVLQGFKLPAYTAAATLDIESLESAAKQMAATYHLLSKFPSVWQDISLKVPRATRYAELHEAIERTISKTAATDWTVDNWPLTIYQDDKDTKHKTVSFRIRVTSRTNTLTDKAVTQLLDSIAIGAETTGAVRI